MRRIAALGLIRHWAHRLAIQLDRRAGKRSIFPVARFHVSRGRPTGSRQSCQRTKNSINRMGAPAAGLLRRGRAATPSTADRRTGPARGGSSRSVIRPRKAVQFFRFGSVARNLRENNQYLSPGRVRRFTALRAETGTSITESPTLHLESVAGHCHPRRTSGKRGADRGRPGLDSVPDV